MILFIDDEPRRVQNDVEELRLRGFQVHVEESADEAIEYFEKHTSKVQAIVCDVMLPHGSRLAADETSDGMRTGVAIFERFRRLQPQVCFVFFTNLSADTALEERFEVQEENCLYLQKRNYLPHSFADEVEAMLLRSGRSARDGGER